MNTDVINDIVFVALVSSFVKFVLTKYGISEAIGVLYDTYKKKWMPERCEYCFNVEICIIVAISVNYLSHPILWIVPFAASPLIRFIEK